MELASSKIRLVLRVSTLLPQKHGQSARAGLQCTAALLGRSGSAGTATPASSRLRVLGRLAMRARPPVLCRGSFRGSSTKALDRRSSQKCQVLSKAPDSIAEALPDLQEPSRNEEAEGAFQVPVGNLRALLRLWDIDTIKTDYYELLVIADYLERLGLDVYFCQEIKAILDRVFRIWTENSPRETASILGDLQVVGLAFYLLRSHEYDVQPSVFQLYQKEDRSFSKTPGEQQGSIGSTPSADLVDLLNLLRASDLKFRRDVILQDACKFASTTLTSLIDGIQQPPLAKKAAAEVQYRLAFPWAINLRMLETRQTILNFDVESVTAKFGSSARLSSQVLSLMITTATGLFNDYNSMFQKEIECIRRWSQESGCEEVNVRPSMILMPFYLGLAYDLPQARYAHLRMEIWSKIWYIMILQDDVFEGPSDYSLDDLSIFIDAHKQFDPSVLEKIPDIQTDRYKPFRVVYHQLYKLIKECAEYSSKQYGPDVVQNFVDIFLLRLDIYYKERKWKEVNHRFTVKEYVEDYAIWSFGPETGNPFAYYFIPGLTLSPSFLEARPDMEALFPIAKTGRILNDARSYQHEKLEGKSTQLVTLLLEENPGLPEEEAFNMVHRMAASAMEEATEAILRSPVPYREVRQLALNTFRTITMAYYTVDGLRNPDWPLSKLCDLLPTGQNH